MNRLDNRGPIDKAVMHEKLLGQHVGWYMIEFSFLNCSSVLLIEFHCIFYIC